MKLNAKPLSIEDHVEARKLINKNILCADCLEALGHFAMLIDIDYDKKRFKCRMTGGEGDKNWYHSIRYFKYIIEE